MHNHVYFQYAQVAPNHFKYPTHPLYSLAHVRIRQKNKHRITAIQLPLPYCTTITALLFLFAIPGSNAFLITYAGSIIADATSTTIAPHSNNTLDMYFFDVSGPVAGERYVVRGTSGAGGFATHQIVTWDTLPAIPGTEQLGSGATGQFMLGSLPPEELIFHLKTKDTTHAIGKTLRNF
jgi:hypothetical protein